MIIKEVEKCGKGLFATKSFLEGDYICVYGGKVISERQYKRLYSGKYDKCYTFHIQFDSHYLVVDATDQHDSLARMANHSWKKYNAEMFRKTVRGKTYVVMFAHKDIKPGHEIRYNYGDQVVAESGNEYPWLREVVEYN